MPSQNIHVLTEALKSFEDVSNELAKLQKVLRYLLDGNLDFENVRVRGLTAETINVTQLSAIAADLGTITAGIIYGAYIATANGAFPRAEMSNTNNLFAAFSAADKYARLAALDSGTSAPTLTFRDGAVPIVGLIYLDAALQEFNINTTKNIRLAVGLGGYTRLDGIVRVNDWTSFERITPYQTLQQALDAKQNSFSGFTGTIYVAATAGGPTNTAKTFVNGVCTS